MLEPGDIIEAKAILIAVDQQSILPIELRLKLDAIDTKLATDSNYFNQAIRDCIDLFANYPQIQSDYDTYNLREGLGDGESDLLARSQSFYQKFIPDLKDLEIYRKREQGDQELNELLSSRYQLLSKPLDGFYYPVQLGDTYALQLNYSGKLVGDKPDKQPKDYQIAVRDLELAKILPPLDGNSFGQTLLLTAFVKDNQVDQLEIAKDCDRQITGKSSTDLARSKRSIY
jgi:hypothetical protein